MDDPEGLESPFRPSSSFSELNSSSCRCSWAPSRRAVVVMAAVVVDSDVPLLLPPATPDPGPPPPPLRAGSPRTRPLPGAPVPWGPLAQSAGPPREEELLLQPGWAGGPSGPSDDEGGPQDRKEEEEEEEDEERSVCMDAGAALVEDDSKQFGFSLSCPPPPPPPPPSPPSIAPPLSPSVKSRPCWDRASGPGRSVAAATEPGAACRPLAPAPPLGMPTRWLWLEWLVSRSFISSYEPSVLWTRLASASPLLVCQTQRRRGGTALQRG